MAKKKLWKIQNIQCPEESRRAQVVLEFQAQDKPYLLKSIHCDNPKLQDLNNWNCTWSCWEKIEAQLNQKD